MEPPTSSPTAKAIEGWDCESCRTYIQKAFSITSPYDLDKLFDAWRRHQNQQNCKNRILDTSKTHTGNGKPQGAFAFTLTKGPNDPQSVADMVLAVKKVMSQKSCPVKRYAWYYEDKGRDNLGDAVHPHIHGMYETESGGQIERKHWKRAWPLWDPTSTMGSGFRGGYHRPVKLEEAYAHYIAKDGGMGESKNIDQQTV